MSIFDNFEKIKNSTKPENRLNLIVYYFYRPIGFLFASIVYNTKILPNHLTIFKYLLSIISLYLIGISELNSINFSTGFILYFIADILDYADGSLARAKKLTSKFGRILDTASDHFFSSIFIFLITLKLQSELHLYLMIIFLSLSWTQVYINTLLKLFKKNDNDRNQEQNYNTPIKKERYQNNFLKEVIKKVHFFNDLISNNLNLVILFLFILLNSLLIYLLFFFICKSFSIILNCILIIRNNITFLNTEDND